MRNISPIYLYGIDKFEFEDEYFSYVPVEIEHITGWELVAKRQTGIKKYKCKAVVKSLPVISLHNTFFKYRYEHIDISEVDTRNVIIMNNTFSSANLNQLDLSNNNLSNVMTMNGCFEFNDDIININFGNNTLEKCQDMNGTFKGCHKLEGINAPNLSTNRLSVACAMFANCRSLKSIDLSKFNFSNTINMNHMFAFCVNLEQVDFGKQDLSHLTSGRDIITESPRLKRLDLSMITKIGVTELGLFSSCERLELIDLRNAQFIGIGNNSILELGEYCKNLRCIIVKDENIANIQSDFGYTVVRMSGTINIENILRKCELLNAKTCILYEA